MKRRPCQPFFGSRRCGFREIGMFDCEQMHVFSLETLRREMMWRLNPFIFSCVGCMLSAVVVGVFLGRYWRDSSIKTGATSWIPTIDRLAEWFVIRLVD